MGWVLHSQIPGPGLRPPHQLCGGEVGESASLQTTKVILRITSTSHSAGLKGPWGGGPPLPGLPPPLTSGAPCLSKDHCIEFSERGLQGSPLPRDRDHTPPPDSPRLPTPHCSSPEPMNCSVSPTTVVAHAFPHTRIQPSGLGSDVTFLQEAFLECLLICTPSLHSPAPLAPPLQFDHTVL